MEALPHPYSQQTFLFNVFNIPRALTGYSAAMALPPLAVTTSGVDWNQVVAVRLLGIALGALLLIWAIRKMFGKK
jgi:hypothetical protein